jgi:hypothetical protein
MADEGTTPGLLAEWNVRLSDALGIPRADVESVLDLAGVVARNVVRPAAPLSTFLVGYATAMRAMNGESPTESFQQAVSVARALASGGP